ncbi:MAG: tripartite tricarboxylate transporter substrate-binding protein [Burkholderiaceae bacterium]|nr:tripartite tricarboxylate transporter substrate-binding protein [Burkholderiaceae bacterium]
MSLSHDHRRAAQRRALLSAAVAALATAVVADPARAQSDKPIRFVLPNAVGSGIDLITRTAQPALAKALGRPVVVENQPGAGGVVGLQTLARSTADGSTLSVVSNNVVIFPSVLKSLPFDMPGDFAPIAVVGYTPVVLVVNPKVPANNARELITWLKERKGEANYASGGNGTILHLATAMFLDEAGVGARHIPYKGVGPMLTDVIGGQVEFATAALPSVQQHLKTGALKAIGVATAQRVPAAPEIPTFVEQGLPGYVVEAWFAVIGPKGLPAAEVQRVHAAVVQAFNDPAVKDAMAKQGNVIDIQPPERAAAFFRSELAKYAALVKKAGVEAQ